MWKPASDGRLVGWSGSRHGVSLQTLALECVNWASGAEALVMTQAEHVPDGIVQGDFAVAASEKVVPTFIMGCLV